MKIAFAITILIITLSTLLAQTEPLPLPTIAAPTKVTEDIIPLETPQTIPLPPIQTGPVPEGPIPGPPNIHNNPIPEELQNKENPIRNPEELKKTGIDNTCTPIELILLTLDKINTEAYEDAIYDYVLATAYMTFDSTRVSDQSASQAEPALRAEFIERLTDVQKEKLEEALSKMDKTKMKEIMEKVGPPTYFPQYMVNHGTNALLGSTENALNPDFDSQTTWNQLVESLSQQNETNP